MATLVQRTIGLNGRPFHFYHPENDDTMLGTLSCLREDKFRLSEVKFEQRDVVVDLGCNIGLLSMLIGVTAPGVDVFAFDASPLAIDCLRGSAALNAIPALRAFNVAVGAEEKRGVQFFSNGKEHSCLVREGLSQSNPTLDSTVNQIAVDEIFDSALLGIGRVKYLKMDIEGAEFEIFERLFGVRPDILDRIEYLHLETHRGHGHDADALEQRVRAKFGEKVFFDV